MNDNEVGQFIDWVIEGLPESKSKYEIETWVYAKMDEWYIQKLYKPKTI